MLYKFIIHGTAVAITVIMLASPNYGEVFLKGTFDFAGQQTAESSESYISYEDRDISSGISGGIYWVKTWKYFDAGLGMDYLFSRKIQSSDEDESFSFLPINLLIRIKYPLQKFSPFLSIAGGYPLEFANEEYKKSWGWSTDAGVDGESTIRLGLGVELSKTIATGIYYSVYNGGLGTGGNTPSTFTTYTTLSLGFIYTL